MATRFRALLRDVAGGLEAPHPARVRILEELSSDLEDLYDTLRAEGLSERQARRRAAEMLTPAPHASEALTHVHRPIWVRLVARFSDRTRHRAERALLAGLTLLVMASTVAMLASLRLLRDPSPFLAVVLVLAWVQSSVALAATALLVALGCAFAWMFFMRRAAVMEDAEAKLLKPAPGPLSESGGWIRSAHLTTSTDFSRRRT